MPSSPSVSRRQFLRRGLLSGAAGIAMPYLLPSGVLAAAGRPGANDRIGIAGVGIGRQGSGVLAGALHCPESRFVAIADVNLPRAEQIAKKYKGQACQDYRKVLERKDVDAIVTATPEHWRALICIRACQAGKDLYAEKPVSLTIREGRLMVQAARKYGRVFQVGSQQRSQPINRAASEFLRKGGLGKITKVVTAELSQPLLLRPAGTAGARRARLGHVVRPHRRWCRIIPSCTFPAASRAGFPSGRIPAAR